MDNLLTNKNKHTDLISVIMPAYNAGNFIREAIQSVTDQTHSNWELIVVDDGSTDNTGDVVRKFSGSDPRIHYFYQHNAGQGNARNKGLSLARGQYVAFLDADDVWMPEKLQFQLSIISSIRADLVFSDAYVFEHTPARGKTMEIKSGFFKGAEGADDFFSANYAPLLTVFAKKEMIEKAGGFSESREIHEDYHLWIRLLIEGYTFFGINRPLAYYRSHPASSSSGEGRLIFLAINTLLDIKGRYPDNATIADQNITGLIQTYLTKMNISRWSIAQRLLEVHNSLPGKTIPIPFWKRIYKVFGKEFFRILFGIAIKKEKHTHKKHLNVAFV